MNQSKTKILPLPVWVYIIVWLLYIYLFVQILSFRADNPNNIILSGLYFVEFGVHEVSHMVVTFLPQIYVAIAGSFGEISFTLLILYATIKARSYFASIFAGLWTMLAMNCVGIYIADARSQLLPLAGPGDNIYHDWHFIFDQLGWLNYDGIIGGTVRGIGDAIGITVLIFGLVLIVIKIKQSLTNKSNVTV